MADDPIVALGLLTQQNLDQLGSSLQKLWPVNDAPCFGGILSAIDDADRVYWETRDQEAPVPSATEG